MKICTRHILTMANSKMRSNFQNLDTLGVKKGLKGKKNRKNKGAPNFMKNSTGPILAMEN